jgi:hypothetical protein
MIQPANPVVEKYPEDTQAALPPEEARRAWHQLVVRLRTLGERLALERHLAAERVLPIKKTPKDTQWVALSTKKLVKHLRRRSKWPAKPARLQKKIQEIATDFVNLRVSASSYEQAKDFLSKYNLRGISPKSAALACLRLRRAWRARHREIAERGLEEIFSGLRSPAMRPAWRIELGRSAPVYERRDLMDDIGRAILEASKHRLLKFCWGHKRGWPCPQPYLVADERRRKFCYPNAARPNCGEESTLRSNRRSWHKNKARWRPAQSARGATEGTRRKDNG